MADGPALTSRFVAGEFAAVDRQVPGQVPDRTTIAASGRVVRRKAGLLDCRGRACVFQGSAIPGSVA